MALIVTVLGLIFSIYMMIRHRDSIYFMLVAFSIAAGLITGLVVDAPVAMLTRSHVDVSYNLAALNDGKDTRGSFFLGSGQIDSVPSFMFYAQDGDGYVLRSWDADSSRVVETDGTPRAVYTCDDYGTVPRPFRWTTKMILDDGWGWVDCDHAFVTFYVPHNSIKQQYNLDAQ